ncbi:hypothetical protein CTI12_AA554510 [Artemisia annua]|uniref:Uncharacterized protein n=1 Tax=Artemisia annua TaxID=35608 RepID=A0A2U1KVS6_ARTAN|nr:hypothetical protein CTI12_AA554510 [Artemisia annua]
MGVRWRCVWVRMWILLMYMKIPGVVAADGPFTVSRRNKLNDDEAHDGIPFLLGNQGTRRKHYIVFVFNNATKKDKEMKFTLEFSWDTVKGKVADSIIAIENGTKFKNKVIEAGQTANKPSSLYAIPQGLKFRLMQASFHWHKNEFCFLAGCHRFPIEGLCTKADKKIKGLLVVPPKDRSQEIQRMDHEDYGQRSSSLKQTEPYKSFIRRRNNLKVAIKLASFVDLLHKKTFECWILFSLPTDRLTRCYRDQLSNVSIREKMRTAILLLKAAFQFIQGKFYIL